MKLFSVLLLLSLTLSVFAQDGYVCLPESSFEAAALDRVKAKLGEDYFAAIGIVNVRQETCADIHIPEYKDACKVGKLNINIDHDLNANLIVSKNQWIRLTCELNLPVGPMPATGGSN